MTELFPSIYITRGADFGSNFEQKIALFIFAVILVIWDSVDKKRLDIFWVFITGTIIWTGAEYALQVTGAREIQPPHLFGYPLPLIVSTLLQGIAEGAFVAVFGLFIADRFVDKKTRTLAVGMFIALSVFILVRAFFPEEQAVAMLDVPPSRRNILAPRGLIFIACMTLFNFVFWIKIKSHRERFARLGFAMFLLVLIWTVGQVMMGSRWVEIDGESASFITAFMVLTFDIVFEATMAYLPFYAIPVLLKFGIRP